MAILKCRQELSISRSRTQNYRNPALCSTMPYKKTSYTLHKQIPNPRLILQLTSKKYINKSSLVMRTPKL